MTVDKKTTDLAATTQLRTTDQFYVATNLSGTPTDKHIEAKDLDNMFHVEHYGDVGTADDTATIQACIDAVSVTDGGPGGPAVLDSRNYAYTQIEIKDGVTLFGNAAGVGTTRGSTLSQIAGTNDDGIIFDTSFAATDYQHYTGVENLELIGVPTDTAGSGIRLVHRAGESFTLRRLLIVDMPGHGISLEAGGTAAIVEDIHCFRCGVGASAGHGVNIQKGGSDVWNGLWMRGISGDNNEDGLIRIQGFASNEENLVIRDVKSEVSVASAQPTVLTLDNCLGPITLDNVSCVGSQTQNSFVRIVTANCRVQLRQCKNVDTDFLIDDVVNTVTVAATSGAGDGPIDYVYNGASTPREKYRLDENGLTIGYLGVTHSSANTNTIPAASDREIEVRDSAGAVLGYLSLHTTSW